MYYVINIHVTLNYMMMSIVPCVALGLMQSLYLFLVCYKCTVDLVD